MTLLFIRTFFVIFSAFVGYYLTPFKFDPMVGAGIGAGTGLLIILLESSMRRVSVRGLSSIVFGLLLGVFMANMLAYVFELMPVEDSVRSLARVILTLLFSYLGAVMALRGKDEFNVIIPYVRFKRQDMDERINLLDTSVIVDGRIADIYKTNFFDGRIVVPRFVLQELQRLADSKDSLKRQRGRRGLDLLRKMQKDSSMAVIIHEDDVPGEEDVDAKLVKLAKIMDGRVCTMDYNLGRIATIQSVGILNINELISAVKVVLLPGEEIDVQLLKEGKEPNQAIAYTDDGTMIVVSEGRRLIGKKVKVIVTSVLQTQGGRMIFARIKKTEGFVRNFGQNKRP